MKAFCDSRQQGFTLVSAIFILVVLAALGAGIVMVGTTQQMGSALDIQGARAYQAARAGIEWGAYQVNSSNGWNTDAPNTRTCPAAADFQFPVDAAALADFTVTVACTSFPDGNGGPTVFRIDAVACSGRPGTCPGNLGSQYVERRLTVTF